jgi:hypothetical protein
MRRNHWVMGAVAVALASSVMAPALSAAAATSAKSEYEAALKAASSQNVHFVSRATQQGVVLDVVGDTGVTSGSQVLEVQDGSTAEQLSVVLINSTGYVRGNDSALRKILGISATKSTKYSNTWLSFPTSNTSLAELVSGLRNSEVPTELKMSGPYTFGGTKNIAGQATQAIDGKAATSSGTKVSIVLYVASTGTPRPVAEAINPTAKNPSIEEEVTFSKWGEQTHPKAPTTSIPLIPLLPSS